MSRAKLYFPFFMLVYSMCSCATHKDAVTNSTTEVEKELFQRWKLDYGMANGQRIDGLPESPNNDYLFEEDGIYLLFNADGTFMTGTWEYDMEDKNIVTKRDDGVVNGRVKVLGLDSLVLMPPKNNPKEDLGLEFYYVPIK